MKSTPPAPSACSPGCSPTARSSGPATHSRSSTSTTCAASTPRCELPRRAIAEAIAASGTSLTERFGVGPVVAATVIGYTGGVARFRNRDHFAAYTGAAPIEMSSGGRITHRLSRRGNRQLNHALHIAAITQIRFPHSPGRGFFERKVAQGKTKKEAVRALKRRIADAAYPQLLIDARKLTGPGGQPGRLCNPAWPAPHPDGRLFGSTTPGPEPTLEPAASPRERRSHRPPEHQARKLVDNKEEIDRARLVTFVW
jgi:hypothetical protein